MAVISCSSHVGVQHTGTNCTSLHRLHSNDIPTSRSFFISVQQDFDWTSLAGRSERQSKTTVALIIGLKWLQRFHVHHFPPILQVFSTSFRASEATSATNSWGCSSRVSKA